MAHLVEKMFYVQEHQRDFPWHIDETWDRTVLLDPTKRPKTFKKARKLAGMDWDPEAVPMFTVGGSQFHVDPNDPFQRERVLLGDKKPKPVDGYQVIRRSDTKSTLHASLRSYNLITNTDMGLIIDTVLDGHDVKYETGGCLDDGRKVWLMLQMGDLIEVPGDPSPHVKYLAVLNTHDGSGVCKVIATNVRIVCANTFHYADTQAQAKMQTFAFYHRSRWREHLDTLQADVKTALSGASKELGSIHDAYRELIGIKVGREEAETWMDEFVYADAHYGKLKPGSIKQRNVDEARATARALLDGPTCEGIAGTVYGLFNAATEWSDHERKYHSNGSYLNRSVFNKEDLKYRAWRMALEQAKIPLDAFKLAA